MTVPVKHRGPPGADQDTIVQSMQACIDGKVLPGPREFTPGTPIETTPIARVPSRILDPAAKTECRV